MEEKKTIVILSKDNWATFLKFLLEKEGHEVEIIRLTDEAVTAIRSGQVKLVIAEIVDDATRDFLTGLNAGFPVIYTPMTEFGLSQDPSCRAKTVDGQVLFHDPINIVWKVARSPEILLQQLREFFSKEPK